jgi:hypothetical protein
MQKTLWLTTLAFVATAVVSVSVAEYGQNHPDSTVGRLVRNLKGTPAAPAAENTVALHGTPMISVGDEDDRAALRGLKLLAMATPKTEAEARPRTDDFSDAPTSLIAPAKAATPAPTENRVQEEEEAKPDCTWCKCMCMQGLAHRYAIAQMKLCDVCRAVDQVCVAVAVNQMRQTACQEEQQHANRTWTYVAQECCPPPCGFWQYIEEGPAFGDEEQPCCAPRQTSGVAISSQPAPVVRQIISFQPYIPAQMTVQDLVVYPHEWFPGDSHLGPNGAYHFQQIVKQTRELSLPVVIQAEENEGLNQARYNTIVHLLLQAGLKDAPQRVILAKNIGENLTRAPALPPMAMPTRMNYTVAVPAPGCPVTMASPAMPCAPPPAPACPTGMMGTPVPPPPAVCCPVPAPVGNFMPHPVPCFPVVTPMAPPASCCQYVVPVTPPMPCPGPHHQVVTGMPYPAPCPHPMPGQGNVIYFQRRVEVAPPQVVCIQGQQQAPAPAPKVQVKVVTDGKGTTEVKKEAGFQIEVEIRLNGNDGKQTEAVKLKKCCEGCCQDCVKTTQQKKCCEGCCQDCVKATQQKKCCEGCCQGCCQECGETKATTPAKKCCEGCCQQAETTQKKCCGSCESCCQDCCATKCCGTQCQECAALKERVAKLEAELKALSKSCSTGCKCCETSCTEKAKEKPASCPSCPGCCGQKKQASCTTPATSTTVTDAAVKPAGFTNARLMTRMLPVGDLIDAGTNEEQLVETCMKMVAPDSWQENGGLGQMVYYAPGRCLILRQTADVTEEVEEYLDQLRQQVKPPFPPDNQEEGTFWLPFFPREQFIGQVELLPPPRMVLELVPVTPIDPAVPGFVPQPTTPEQLPCCDNAVTPGRITATGNVVRRSVEVTSPDQADWLIQLLVPFYPF